MKKNILALAIGSVLSAGVQADVSNIIITEAVDNKADYNNRALEITNTGADAYTFPATVELGKQVNGGTWYTLSGTEGLTIDAGKTAVLYGPNATAELIATITANGGMAIKSDSQLNGTGNDAYVIRDVTDPANPIILDAVGVIDSSSDWGKDSTLSRKLAGGNMPTQNGGAFDISNWDVDTTGGFEGLGAKPGQDPVDPPAPEPSACTTDPQTTIAEVQGPGNFSPLITSGYESTEAFNVQGIVTAVTTVPTKGFYLAEISPDGDPATSDGIFVSSSSAKTDMIGKTVCVTSKVKENYGLTQLTASKWDEVDPNSSVPAAVDLEMIPEDAGSFQNTLERHEGMLVNLPQDIDPNEAGNQDMRVSKTIGFNFDSFRNNMVFSYKRPNMQPNQDYVAGSAESKEYAEQNNDYRLIVESSEKAADGRLPYYPTFHTDAENTYIRIDDGVTGMEGVLTYGYGDFSFVVTNEVDKSNFKHNTDRRDSPDLSTSTTDDSFAIKVGTQNLLNLFNSPFGGAANQHGDNRGADDIAEYERQKEKIVSAIRGLDADVVGLMEIENNGFGDTGAISELVAAINVNYDDDDPKDEDSKYSISNRYVFIGYDKNGDMILDDQDSLGTDAISTGILYRPSKVSLESTKVIPMPQQHAPAIVNDNNVVVKDKNGAVLESGDNYQRDTLAATFIVNQTGKRLTVAVNHLKSKGSTCFEEWDGVDFGTSETWDKDPQDADFQGSCENFRVAAAVQLGEELAKIGGDSIIVGDMNSYALEDPMLVLTNNETGKTLTTARDTFIGKKPQFNSAGNPVNITKTYGYVNAVTKMDKVHKKSSWSYSYNDEIGSLDHVLVTPSLESRLIDATDWHINAAESGLYDYNINYKGSTGATDFYEASPFRSSDHDSAIISLSYKHGETDSQPVHLTIKSSLIDVPYSIPAAAGAKQGDIATITLTPLNSDDNVDMSKVVLPRVALTKNGQALVELEVFGLDASLYQANMTLTRDDTVVTGSQVSMKVNVAKRDSLTPEIVVTPYDGSGGSFSIFGVLSLLGLGFLRRKAK